jgi:tight adherence protein B
VSALLVGARRVGFVRLRAAGVDGARPPVRSALARTLDRWPRPPRRERLPELLEEVARSLRSGASVEAALGEASAGGWLELDPVVARLRRGDRLDVALRSWTDGRGGSPAGASGVALAVAALTLAGEQGGSRAWAVDQVAATLRERLALDGELRAQASQASASAAVIVLSPLAFSVLSAAVDPRVTGFLLTPPGWMCLAGGLALDAGGVLWMRRILRGAA